MDVVYFSIIPTFEPSRYCKCWIVCFYHTKLFGADVKIVVESKDGNVASAQLTFPSVAKDSLVNAISEQLGADGTEEADKTSWSYEDRNVVLTEGDQGNVVTISK